MASNPPRAQFWQLLNFELDSRFRGNDRVGKLAVCLLLCAAAMTGGCVSKKIALVRPTPTALQKEYEAKCRNDYQIHVITRLVKRTFWIYAPTDKPLFDFAAEPPAAPTPSKKPAKYDLLYIDGAFKNNAFNFEYDIIPKIKSNLQSEGIRNEGTDYFNKLYNNLFTAITETLLKPNIPISFVVMVITDIKKGIEVRYTFYLEDYRMASVGALPYDEFSKRILQESKGSTDFIGDQVGQHLEYTDITMPEFLTKQMINRIRFKFTQSDFPPQENYEEVIVGIIADTARYYHFKDFQEVRTDDLRNKKKMIFSPGQLDYFGEDRPKNPGPKSNGKLIHIIFDNGKATFKEE